MKGKLCFVLRRLLPAVLCFSGPLCSKEAACGLPYSIIEVPNSEHLESRCAYSVAIDQDAAVVGDVVTNLAYLFDVQTGETRFVLRPDPEAGRSPDFGRSVDIDGSLAVVGSPGDNSQARSGGAVFVFDTDNGELLSKLVPPNPEQGALFGHSVATDGHIAVVSSVRFGEEELEYVDVFDVKDGSHQRRLTAPSGAVNFGRSVALDGNLALIGSGYDDPNTNQAFVFEVTTGEMIQRLSITTEDALDRYNFGSSVAIDAGRAAIGEYPTLPDYSGSGAVDVFDIDTGELLFEFTSDVPDSKDFFGASVGVSANMLIVGAPDDKTIADVSGATYLFDLSTGEQLAKITGLGGGDTVSIDGRRAMFNGGEFAYIVEVAEPASVLPMALALMLVCSRCCRSRNRCDSGLKEDGMRLPAREHDVAAVQSHR